MPRVFLWPLAAVAAAALLVFACGDDDDSDDSETDPTQGSTEINSDVDPSVALANPTETSSGLKYEDIVVGDGESPADGKIVSVHYTGWLTDGTKFDSSVDRGEPITYQVGAVSLIDGWVEGLSTMKEGGTRRLEIPPELGYGSQGREPAIPPDATLVFELELIEVSDP